MSERAGVWILAHLTVYTNYFEIVSTSGRHSPIHIFLVLHRFGLLY